MKNKVTGIYKITEKSTGRCYIGQSKNIYNRWKGHQRERFTIDKFDYEIVAYCLLDKEALNFWEKHCIIDYDAHVSCGGFNYTWGGNGSWGSKSPEETARKKSLSTTGRKRQPHTEETKQKIKDNRTQPIINEIQLENFRQKTKDLWQDEDYRKKVIDAVTEAQNRPEVKLKKSLAMKGLKREKTPCPYCGLFVAAAPMKRWHGDNCKMKEKI